MEQTIKEWYQDEYPEDEMAEDLRRALSFEDLWDKISYRVDISKVIGTDDYTIQERVLAHLADLLDEDPEIIHHQVEQSRKGYIMDQIRQFDY